MDMLRIEVIDRLAARWRRRAAEQGGQAIVEYALILGLIVTVGVAAVQLLGLGLLSLLSEVASKMP